MTAVTLADVETWFGFSALDYLDREASIPVVTRAACQGDVSFLRVTTKAAVTPVPGRGVVVATGQGGHDHTVQGAGCFFDLAPVRDGSLVIGTFTVPAGGEGFVTHVEHGALAFAPGTYRVGSQREFAGEWQAVED